MGGGKRILLIDHDDRRRDTRVAMLKRMECEVELREDDLHAEAASHEGRFDLVVIALHRRGLDRAAAYSERIRAKNPDLPILLLTDQAVYVPNGTFSRTLEAGVPRELVEAIAEMLSGSKHLRELSMDPVSPPQLGYSD